MADNNFTTDESDFEDAIIEIAQEIELEKANEISNLTIKSVIQPDLKIESKQIEALSENFEESQKVRPEPLETIEAGSIRKETESLDDSLKITDTGDVKDNRLDYHNLTIEDLFEDIKPEDKTPDTIYLMKDPSDTKVKISTIESRPSITPLNHKKSNDLGIKTVNIPDIISQNISQRLKRDEREIIKRLLKMQKR
jgi:hypothetical protein